MEESLYSYFYVDHFLLDYLNLCNCSHFELLTNYVGQWGCSGFVMGKEWIVNFYNWVESGPGFNLPNVLFWCINEPSRGKIKTAHQGFQDAIHEEASGIQKHS